MSITKTIGATSIDTAEEGAGAYGVEEPADGRLVTLRSYVNHTSADARSHTFELRYAAFGEKSNMVCALTRASSRAVRPDTPDNALETSIDLEGRAVASALLAMDSKEGLAADLRFSEEMSGIRSRWGDKVCEIGNLMISRENRSRRALGAMFHVIYLYARQARQMKVMVLQSRPRHAAMLEKMMGFKAIGKKGQRVLMVLELDFIKKEQRTWGGTKDEGAQSPYLLYPFFFPAKDEAGLLLRLLAHLGTNYGSI